MVSTAPAPVRLRADGNTTVFVLHAVSTSLNGSTEPSQVLAEAMGYHAAGVSAAPQLWQEHTAAWQERWVDGRIEVGGDLSLAQSVAPAFAVAQHGDAAPADDGVQPVA